MDPVQALSTSHHPNWPPVGDRSEVLCLKIEIGMIRTGLVTRDNTVPTIPQFVLFPARLNCTRLMATRTGFNRKNGRKSSYASRLRTRLAEARTFQGPIHERQVTCLRS